MATIPRRESNVFPREYRENSLLKFTMCKWNVHPGNVAI